ncbi:MAG: inorganic diphosphatase [Candidatus Gracilibacteria bacterium]|jgi:inorganic pyrophosphatase|nr:inorganic diphosphatase [Candidatus Gracilibacteria bacterium]
MKDNNPFHIIPAKDGECINIIVEIAKNSRTKYEFNKKYGVIEVDRVLHTPIAYPFSYGLIPQTWNDYDHDPLDAIIISSESIMPGALTRCKVVGMLSVDDNGERDDKVLAVLADDPYVNHIESIDDMGNKLKEDIHYFMEHYKDLEKKTVKVNAWQNKKEAEEFIEECIECYFKTK